MGLPTPEVPRKILHVDMDAFFAAVEQLERPELRGMPVLVGGSSKRGVVAAASYEARPFGVRSAMPMAEALRRCPHARVISPRHERYRQTSRAVFAIFRRYTPLVEPLSLDEAFLDVTGSQRLFGDAVALARHLKAAVREETGLAASAGVASCKFVAKLASDLGKPDGLFVVPEDVEAFLAPMPIERMWGVGPAAAERLHAAGVRTLGDLAQAPPHRLQPLLGSLGPEAARLARGIDPREVVPDRAPKSLGSEETFPHDLPRGRALERKLLAHCGHVAKRLLRAGLHGRSVTVKLKYVDFDLCTRARHVPEGVMDTDALFEVGKQLLDRIPMRGRRARLLGVSVAALQPGPPQPMLFESPRSEQRRKLEQAVSTLDARMGPGKLTRAALLESDED